MTRTAAAESLQTKMQGKPWLTAVGTGKDHGNEAIFVYVSSLKHAELAQLNGGWYNYPVIIRKMGPPRPI